MPKTKEFVSSEESDSGSGSDEPKAKKKKVEKAKAAPKTEDKKEDKKPKEKGASSEEKGPNGEIMFQLAKMRYATVSEFRGKVMVSIREYYEKDDSLRPGKKGISLSVEQWNSLKEHIDDIDAAVKKF